MDMFETAVKKGYRFPTNIKGLITVEDVYKLPLNSEKGASLNRCARALKAEMKSEFEEDFVNDKPVENEDLQMKFDIVMHIIKVKKDEADGIRRAKEIKEHNEKILILMEKNKDKELEGMKNEDLEKMLIK